jgi:hypothetical protein
LWSLEGEDSFENNKSHLPINQINPTDLADPVSLEKSTEKYRSVFVTPMTSIEQFSHQILDFLKRVLKSTKVNCSTLFLALKLFYLYGKNQTINCKDLELMSTKSRVLLIGMMLANKFTEDHPYSNKAWSTLTGLSIIKINEMENQFLSVLNYKIFISETEFITWVMTLQKFFKFHLPPPLPNSDNFANQFSVKNYYQSNIKGPLSTESFFSNFLSHLGFPRHNSKNINYAQFGKNRVQHKHEKREDLNK